jgi:hypothetical protein
MSNKEISFWLEVLEQAANRSRPALGVKVDQNIPTEDKVEFADIRISGIV